jgi:hypothetical protein
MDGLAGAVFPTGKRMKACAAKKQDMPGSVGKTVGWKEKMLYGIIRSASFKEALLQRQYKRGK